MGRWWSNMNGTVRGFIVILVIAAVVFVLNLEGTLVSLSLILRRRTVGLDAFAFIVVLILAGYAMWRVWRSERSYY